MMHETMPDGSNASDNARLIAAAPELLVALLNCVEIIDDHLDGDFPEVLSAAISVIAKATAE